MADRLPINAPAAISWTNNSKTLHRGTLTEATYFDEWGQVSSVVRGGIARTFSYDALGRTVFESLPGKSQGTTTTYDILGRVKTMSFPVGLRSYSYSRNSRWITDERNYVTRFDEDRYGDPDDGYLSYVATPSSVSGASVRINRNKIGVVNFVAQDGVTRTYGRDTHFFLKSTLEPEAGTTTFERDNVGNMTSRTSGGQKVIYGYDGLNRLKSITGPSISVALGYNKRSKVTSVGNAVANRTYAYDANGNLDEDKLVIDGLTFTVGYGYDNLDGLASITYPMSTGTVTYTPDVLGRPTRALPYLSSVGHYNSGNLSSIVFANGVSQTYGENALQLPSSISANSISLGLTYGYDSARNVSSISDAYDASENRTLNYDGINRLITANGRWGTGTINYGGGGNISRQQLGSYAITYGYSDNNRLVTISGSATRMYSYDGAGNVTGNGVASFSYDELAQLKCTACGTGNEVGYQYDGQGRRVTQDVGGRRTYFVHAPSGDLQFEYSPFGQQWSKHVYLHGKRIASRTSVTEATTTTALSVSPSSVKFGQPATLAGTVTGATPTGTITFRDGTAAIAGCIGVALSAGSVTCVTSQIAVGTHSITAAYSGDTFNLPSTSTAVSLAVTPAPDTTPDAFAFTSQFAVPGASLRTSGAITPTGYESPSPISVSGGSYAIGCSGTFTTSAGTITPGQSVCVRHTSASAPNSSVSTSLTIGGVSATFTSTTVQTFALSASLTGNGSGAVISSPGGINCGTACTAIFNAGTAVTFTATPSTSSTFAGWSGACTGLGSCTVTLNAASTVSATFTDLASISHLTNMSTRGPVLTGDSVMIGGFVISGSVPKTVIIKARGPSLIPFGVPDALPNPVLELFSGSTLIASNDDWGSASNAAEIQATGLAPGHALESAILVALSPGAYTAIVSGAGGSTGNGIFEVNEVDHPEVQLTNLSTRGQVQTGDNVMIGGFSISGASPMAILIRARGPSLAPFFPNSYLPNPVLQLFSGQTLVSANDDWVSAPNMTAIQATGMAPGNALESAMFVALNPGAYTAIVSGQGGSTGVGIVEVFPQLIQPVPCTSIGQPDGDCDGIPDALEASVGRNPSAKDNDVFASAQLFAMQGFRDFLVREGLPAGVSNITNAIDSGAYTRAQAVEVYFNTAEYQAVGPPLARLYFAFFNRFPDYAGFEFNAGRLRAGTVTFGGLAEAFAGSPESLAIYGGLDNTQFVTRVYQNLLGRSPSAAELADWAGRLDVGAYTRAQVMLAFGESAEYKALIANEVYVATMFMATVRRAPLATGFANWVASMDAGNPGVLLVNGLLASTEYHNRFLP